mmetsp:Transcript_11966/g.20209  ORF Transcript_11966/g.20209 Transcript_11966/m.20209 type:complete len:176 (-) Transcript_11966:456-983(-)|eukprot:CAMPEP_0198201082 /NCGR_PEP_ID=MMETSP1445-20131203/3896_1 /TAXON_ID=36898 /ORGANISM="Pyramimonas sp., Strain CCMP2087" /LENGTH=175 /DNA_ID=CAMNT_0043871275 /DNA_START=119 /DNA_END=646 /DNA_ORIENTATION=+
MGSSVDEKIEIAKKLKEEGNNAFKAGDLTGAMRSYHQILLYVSGLDRSSAALIPAPEDPSTKLTDEQKADISELTFAHFNNLAAVYVKLEKWEKGMAAGTKALEARPQNLKALYRRGKCRCESGDLDGAQEDLDSAMKVGGGAEDAALQNLSKLLAHKFKLHEKKERKRYAGIFA